MKHLTVMIIAVLVSLTAFPSGAEEELIQLRPKLPKPLFLGTPRNMVSANLEPPNTKRPKIMVPKDVVNLAADKEVTASEEEPIIGELAMITDGDKDGTEGSFVEFGPGLQWIQIDLGAPCEINAVAFWHYHSQARVYHDVIVQVANDEDFAENKQTLFNNDHDNSAGQGVGSTDKEYVETYEGRIAEAKNVRARYVRLYSNGNTSNDLNHCIEVEVYGKPVE